MFSAPWTYLSTKTAPVHPAVTRIHKSLKAKLSSASLLPAVHHAYPHQIHFLKSLLVCIMTLLQALWLTYVLIRSLIHEPFSNRCSGYSLGQAALSRGRNKKLSWPVVSFTSLGLSLSIWAFRRELGCWVRGAGGLIEDAQGLNPAGMAILREILECKGSRRGKEGLCRQKKQPGQRYGGMREWGSCIWVTDLFRVGMGLSWCHQAGKEYRWWSPALGMNGGEAAEQSRHQHIQESAQPASGFGPRPEDRSHFICGFMFYKT